MSSIGNSIAAGVAQTALTAQQVGRQRARADRAATDGRRMQELVEAHLRAIEEGDEFESPAQLHVDKQLPEHSSSQQQPQQRHRQPDAPADDNAPAPEPPANANAPAALYRHLDVQA